MSFLSIIIGIIIGGILSYYLFHHQLERNVETEIEEKIETKEENLNKILSLLEKEEELSNHDVREMIGVSSRTVVRYMDELEERGQVEQVGERGYGVVYKLKK
ncbi:MAG: winged helix-turn-helix transcriptional regulator [Candidatus Paceibacterota bacterium]